MKKKKTKTKAKKENKRRLLKRWMCDTCQHFLAYMYILPAKTTITFMKISVRT